MTRKTKPYVLTDPGTRIASVLRSKSLRAGLAERAGKMELAPRRELEFSSNLIADHLAANRTPAQDAEFFNSRFISEAIILLKGRPVLLVRDGEYEKAPMPEVESWIGPMRKKMVKPIGAVGRVELSDHDTYEWCGTGWRVEEDLIITNRHVALIFAERQGQTFKFRANQMGKPTRARVDFREEYKGVVSEEYGIAKVMWIAPDTDDAPDMAVLQIVRDPGLPDPLMLADKDVVTRQKIAIVGYPARDSRNDAAIMSDIFQDIYDVKRFSPGEVVTSEPDAWYLTHDATTLGGNSGSAVFDLATQKVVGLHFGGSFRKANYAVKSSVIKSILANRSWSAVTAETLKVPFEVFSEKNRTIASMKGRAGYSETFLDLNVPVPTPGASHKILATKSPNDMLPYTHFSIKMSASRRFPIFTAENLNGALKIKLKRRDSWGFDPRIPKSAQVGHTEFYGPQPFDKGHMVRRENPGWGDTQAEAQLGEDDTFVYTNAIPQMPQLNQQTWLSLENYVLDNTKTEGFKVCVFTGPIFRADDPVYGGVQVPTDFWKVVVAIDADTKDLLTSCYMLSQLGMMPTESFRFGPFKTYQVPIKKIEELADITFSKPVRDRDVFGKDEIKEMVASGRFIEITGERDIVLTYERS